MRSRLARRSVFGALPFARVGGALLHAGILVAPAIALQRAADATRPRAIAIVVVLLTLASFESRSPLERRSCAGLALTSALGLLASAWLSIAAHGTNDLWPWLGAVLAIAGVVLRVLAVRALGPGFSSAIEPGPVLVVSGVYGHVRHPSDLGLLLLSAGIAVLGESVPAGIAAAAVGLTIAVRIGREDAVLSQRFRGAHAIYRRRVRALVPAMAPARPRC